MIKLKKSKACIAMLLAALSCTAAFAGCSSSEEEGGITYTENPYFDGVEDIDGIFNQTIDLYERVRAYDDKDGDITGKMKITVDGEASDGIITLTEVKTYKLAFEVTDSDSHSTRVESKIICHERQVNKAMFTETGYYAAGGTASVENGVLTYSVTSFMTNGWDSKVSSEKFGVENPSNYIISFKIKSSQPNPFGVNFMVQKDPVTPGEDMNACFRSITVSNTWTEYRIPITLTDSKKYTYVWEMGSAANRELGATVVEISDANLEEWNEYEGFIISK